MSEMTEEEYTVINQLDPMEKAIFLLMDSSAMTIDDVINLTFGDFVKSIDHYIDDLICPFDIYEIGNLLYLQDNLAGIWEIADSTTISSHESIIAILDYLESERDECIPFDEPLFQCDYGGKLFKYHLLSLFSLIENLSIPERCTQ